MIVVIEHPCMIDVLISVSILRYNMMFFGQIAWLFEATLSAEYASWPQWLGGKYFPLKDRQRVVAAIAVATCACLCIYAVAIVPRLQGRQKVKPIAAQIEAVVPESERLYAVAPDY